MKTWMRRIAWMGAAALVTGIIALAVLDILTGVWRDQAMNRLRAQLTRYEPSALAQEGGPIEASSAPGHKVAASPIDVKSLRATALRLVESLPEVTYPEDRDGLYRRARAILEKARDVEAIQNLSEADLEVLRQYLALNADTWTLLDSLDWRRLMASVSLPDTKRIDNNELSDAQYVGRFRHLVAAVLALRAGDAEGVVREAAWESGDAALMAQMVMAVSDLSEVSPEAEDNLLRQLANRRRRDTYRDHLEAFLGSTLRAIEESPEEMFNSKHPPLIELGRRLGGAPLLNYDVQYFADNAQRVIDASSLPHLQAEPAIRALEEEFLNRSMSSLGGTRMLHRFGGTFDRAREEAWMDLTRLGVTVERYREEHGTYPETLEALQDRFPEGMPEDPFSGASYRYTTDGQTFQVSSVYKGNSPEASWNEITLGSDH